MNQVESRHRRKLCCSALLWMGLVTTGCNQGDVERQDSAAAPQAKATAPHATANVNGQRIVNADAEPGNWLSHGRTYDEQRFSPLDQINAANVGGLGLAWYYDFPTHRGLEATPIVVDGLMYSTGSWSMVYAHNAGTGELLWSYDPQVPREWAVHLCCDVVNRGVAVWAGRVYFGTIDGRLIALDAATGSLEWSVQTTDRTKPYSITGAPRIVDDKVIIGNGGAEYGVRGYVSAYDTQSGELDWRFYTVPGDPAQPFESPVMQMAAKTWTGQWWQYGGGGTVWDSMAYDPKLNLLYIGVGNGSPWNQQIRSPGGGDNLFLSSIVALNPDTGAYVWHYQTTPGEAWDYTATQHLILADIDIDGVKRKVLMQAPKNGFFYVLDRTNGELISAKNFVQVTWATGIDPTTGRPIEVPGARYEQVPAFALPGPSGAHNWHPMSYSPKTGLVYIPAQELPYIYAQNPAFEFAPGFWNTATAPVYGTFPEDPEQAQAFLSMINGQILAWDPVTQQEVWRVQHAEPTNGGLLSTAGNLLFQGNGRGEFVAYAADSGQRLWSAPAQTGVVAAPVTYTAEDEQYVTVLAGWGGSWPLVGGASLKGSLNQNVSRILTFKLGGKQVLPPVVVPPRSLNPPPLTADVQTIALGKTMYTDRCSVCHGDSAVGGGVIPDLRLADAATHAAWDQIVREGSLKNSGMVSFADVLSKEQTDAIRAYVISRAHILAKAQQSAATPE